VPEGPESVQTLASVSCSAARLGQGRRVVKAGSSASLAIEFLSLGQTEEEKKSYLYPFFQTQIHIYLQEPALVAILYFKPLHRIPLPFMPKLVNPGTSLKDLLILVTILGA